MWIDRLSSISTRQENTQEMVKTLLEKQGGRGDHDGDGYVVSKIEYEEFCEFRASRERGATADPAGQTEEGTVAPAAAAGSTAAAASAAVCHVTAARGSTAREPKKVEN